MQTYKKNIEKIVSEKNVEESNNEDNLFKDEIYAYSTDIYSDITNAWIELDKSGNVSLITNKSSELYSKYGNKSKIAENIASIYMCQVGQDDNFDLVMLGFDGSAKSLYISSFFAMKKHIKDNIIQYKNPYPYMEGLVLRSTTRIKNVLVEHRERKEGKSQYTLKKLLSLWINGFTNFSVTPLRVALLFSFIFMLLAIVIVITLIYNKLNNPELKIKAIQLFNNIKAFIMSPKHLCGDFGIDDLMVGHSYFMASSEEELLNKVEYEILPLIAEYINDGIISVSDEEKKRAFHAWLNLHPMQETEDEEINTEDEN